MSKSLFCLFLIFQLSTICSTAEENGVILEINRSKAHYEKTNTLTPLVVTLSSPDQKQKIRAVDLICIVDVSGSMSSDNKMNFAKESLRYLVNLMNDQDKLAVVKFESTASTLFGLTSTTKEINLI